MSSLPSENQVREPETIAGLQTQVNHLNAETIRLMAEANELGSRQLQEFKRITEWLRRDLSAEAERLAQLDRDLHEREAKVQQAEKLFKEAAELKRSADAQAQQNQRTLAEVQTRLTTAESAERRAGEASKTHEQAAAAAREEQERARLLLAQSRDDREKAEAARDEATRSLQETQRLSGEIAKLQAQLLPSIFQSDSWRPWREELVRRAAAEGPVSLLLARLHTAAALERSHRPIAMELVREIGRSVYETFGQQAEKIAQSLTQTGRGQFEIKIVRVGDRVDNKFMKPASTGLVEVRTVAGWAIRDAKGSWQFLAEVA